MTQQYQEESINGQPSAQSLVVGPFTAPAAPAAGVNLDAIFWASLAADAVIVGDAISVAGSAAIGSIIQIAQPGLYSVDFVTAEIGFAAPSAVNILRGVPIGTPIAAPPYPALDFLGFPSPGVEDVRFIVASAPVNILLTTTFRITNADLVDPAGAVNPNRQILFSAVAASIPGLVDIGTKISVERVSM